MFDSARTLAVFAIALGIASLAQASPVPDNFYGSRVLRFNISKSAPNIPYYIEYRDAEFIALARAAIQKWQDVDTAYVTLTEVASAADAQIVIRVLNTLSNGTAAGLAVPTGLGSVITSCEAQILASHATGDPDVDVERTIAHEVGHCLGLAHSIVSGAVMSYRPSADASLHDDDKLIITVLYPEDQTGSLPLGCATVSDSSRKPPGGGANGLGSVIFSFALMCGAYLMQRRLAVSRST